MRCPLRSVAACRGTAGDTDGSSDIRSLLHGEPPTLIRQFSHPAEEQRFLSNQLHRATNCLRCDHNRSPSFKQLGLAD